MTDTDMCEVAVEEQGGGIADVERRSSREEHGVIVETARRRLNPPLSVVWTTALYCAEFITACVLCKSYHKNNDVFWMSLTVTFTLVPAVLIQLTLTFIHRDVGRDRPLVLLLHLLQLGPLIRCFEALVVYFKAGQNEEPYVTLSRKTNLKKGREIELEVGQAERTLATHRNAFKRTAVIQAFLGSTPQLTLQLYANIQEKYTVSVRLALMLITLASITYGALVCSVLAIQITYDSIKVRLRPAAYLCLVLWRALEITTRVTTLVLFSTALPHWVILVGGLNLLFFFFLPWAEFWARRGSLAEGVENNFSTLGTAAVLCAFTLLYACVNAFCWSAVEPDLAHQELIDRKHSWRRLALYYSGRFLENLVLIALWYLFQSDFFVYVCAPLVVAQLLIGYGLAVLFMMLFYQFCHPCRSLFEYNVHDCLRCVCCRRPATRRGGVPPSYSAAATVLKEEPPEPLDPRNRLPPDERESLA